MKKSFEKIVNEAAEYNVSMVSQIKNSFRVYPVNTSDYENRQAWAYKSLGKTWKAYTPYKKNFFIGSKAACANWCLDQVVNGYSVMEN